MKNEAQLITYADRLPGATFRDLQRLLEGPFAGAFGGVHVLPFFYPIDGADAGFDPIDHTQVDPRLGTWDDVAALAARTAVMADVIVNHVSRHSPQFLDYDARGEASPYDIERLRRTGVGRDINRHCYTSEELQHVLKRPIVQAQLALLRPATRTRHFRVPFTRPHRPLAGSRWPGGTVQSSLG